MNARGRMTMGVGALMTSAACVLAGGHSGSGLLVLNATESGALSMTGNSSVQVPAHKVYVNSSSPTAVEAVGRAVINTSSLFVVGGTSFEGRSGCTGSVNTGAPGISDPLEARRFPDPNTMTVRESVDLHNGGAEPITLEPGFYPEGIRISGQTSVVFAPGVFVVGGQGLALTSGDISGEGVSLVVHEGACRVAGASSVRLSPPRSGEMAGIALAQPAHNTTPLHLAGGSEFLVSGTIYAPKATLTMVGNSEAGAQGPLMGDLVIADRVALRGTALIRVGRDGMPMVSFPTSPVYD